MKKTVLFSAALLTAGTSFAAVTTAATAARIADSGLQAVRMEQTFVKNETMSALQLDKSKIVAQKQLKNGRTISLVRGNDGLVRKVLSLKPTNNFTANPVKATLKAQKSAENATFFEGFENYDGDSRGWIPEGWEQVSKTDPAHHAAEGSGASLVWEGVSGDGFQDAFEGNYCERIQVSSFDIDDDGNFIFPEAQDEWLITPAVTPKAGDYLTFQLQYSPAFTLLDMNTLEYTAENSTLEVLVSTDNGANWEKIWDAIDDARSYTEAELDTDAGNIYRPFRQMLVNIGAYAGKSVKFAFRYVGIDGESMMLDNVELTNDIEPAVSMTAPEAVFPIGLSIDGYNLVNESRQPLVLALAPYKTELTWTNTSRPFETNTWTFADVDGSETSVNTKNLEAPAYDFGQWAAPSLTTAIAGNSSEALSLFEDVQYGGDVMVSDGAGGYTTFMPAMYNFKHLVDGSSEISRAGAGIFGMGSESDATWRDLVGGNYKVQGMALSIPQPASPYVISGAYTAVYGTTLTNKSTLTATLYKVERGKLEEVAKGYCSPSEFYRADENSYPVAQFVFEQEIDGLPTQTPVMVDFPAVIQFSADLAAGESFDFAGTFDTDMEAGSNVSVVLVDEKGTMNMISSDALVFGGDNEQMAFTGLFGYIDASYAWLRSDDNTFEANPAGESKTFDIDSYYNLVASDGSDLANVEGEGYGDWYTVSFANTTTTSEQAKMTVTVSQLPEGVDVRSANFTVDLFGLKKTFWVAQRSEAGVGSVAEATSKAMFNGNVIEVESSKATAVAVYNVAGQKVVEKAFTGKAVIPAANLQKGVYVVKFNDNTVVKLAK